MPDDPVDLEKLIVSVAELAEIFDVTPQWLRQLAREGALPTPRAGMLPFAETVRRYLSHLRRRALRNGNEVIAAHVETIIAEQGAQLRALAASRGK